MIYIFIGYVFNYYCYYKILINILVLLQIKLINEHLRICAQEAAKKKNILLKDYKNDIFYLFIYFAHSEK